VSEIALISSMVSTCHTVDLHKHPKLMNTLESILLPAVFFAFLAGVYGLIYKGSRPLQPVPERSVPPKKAVVASFVPVVCTAILYGTFKGLEVYLRDHLATRRPVAFSMIVYGVIAPWFVGIYFAYRAARTTNKILRAIGSTELLLFLLAAAVPLVARG
jgi:hypothetical protein